jgi:predicted O-methyltransferase YrrM
MLRILSQSPGVTSIHRATHSFFRLKCQPLNARINKVQEYFSELKNDTALLYHYENCVKSSKAALVTDLEPRFGRRLAWYAFVRILKPGVVIETGVDKGLGSLVIASALLRNANEGNSGKYYGTDINPHAGFLFSGEYAKTGEILYGDSLESIKRLECCVGLFISDSDHDPDYEFHEYQAVAKLLEPNGLVISDQGTDRLLQFSQNSGREFIFFHDESSSDWVKSSGIGVSWKIAK